MTVRIFLFLKVRTRRDHLNTQQRLLGLQLREISLSMGAAEQKTVQLPSLERLRCSLGKCLLEREKIHQSEPQEISLTGDLSLSEVPAALGFSS